MDALVTAAKNGDKEAFVQLIRMNKQSLYKGSLGLSSERARHCRCTAKCNPVLL